MRLSLLLFVAAGVYLFLTTGFFAGHSARFNYPWAVDYVSVFGWDAVLPKHLPGLWSGLGGYDFFFYAPVPFWFIAAIISPVCSSCETATLILLGAAIFWTFSGVTFYLFARRYVDGASAAFGGIAYAILPYHLSVDWFVRQAIGEFVAYAFIPLIALGIDGIRRNDGYAWTLAIGIAGTAITHLPTALLAGHVFGVVICAIAWQKYREENNLRQYLRAILGWTVLGVLLSSFYWLPALVLIEHVTTDFLYTDYFRAERWLYGFSFAPPSPNFARLVLLSFLTVLPFVCVAGLLSKGSLRLWVIAPVATVIFLNTELAKLLWENWIIHRVQFPWRTMVFVDFSAALAVAFMVKRLWHAASEKPMAAFMLAFCVLLAALPMTIVGQVATTTVEKEGTPFDPTMGALEYLSPEMVSAVKVSPAVESDDDSVLRSYSDHMQSVSETLARNNESIIDVEVSHRRVLIQPLQEVSQISIPVQYWMFWQGEIDGSMPVELTAHAEYGTINVTAPQDGFQGRQVILTLPYHWSEKLGFIVSLIATLLLFFTLLKSSRRSTAVRQLGRH